MTGRKLPPGLRYRLLAGHCRLRRLLTRDPDVARRLGSLEAWYRGVPSELRWWREWLRSEEGVAWRSAALDPDLPIQDPVVADILTSLPGRRLSVIEIGSGPITHLGYTLPDKQIALTPVDPLAREYADLLADCGIVPPVPVVEGDGERLLERFAPTTFDLAWASNALDHCYDPVQVIRNLLMLVQPGGSVVLRHYRNEGASADYEGMHQWNFDICEGHLVLWSRAERHDLNELLDGHAAVSCFTEPSSAFGAFQHHDWMVGILVRDAAA